MIRHGIRLDLAKRTISLVAPSQVSPSFPQSSPAVLQATSPRRGSPCTYPNNIVLPSQTKWTPSPNQETPTSSSAPSIAEVPRTESIRAVVVGPYDEDPTTYLSINLPRPSSSSLSIPTITRRKRRSFLAKSPVNNMNTSTSFARREVPRPYHRRDPTTCALIYYLRRS